VLATAIIAAARDGQTSETYGGHGQCYLEFGQGQVVRVDVTFLTGQPPTGTYEAPSSGLADQKAEFGSTWIRRWFDRDWSTF